ncbi:sulfur carrier protein ThiS [Gordonia zhaorongruii]|uniref:sulfur carrier protein ThiS n=1 Tax=Gordonia zhaorongruii TaxID=2597659 RepID=UPI00104A56EE|nr:sulfur carrier protein ThiS [Gordonia zhaorongruii]
MELVVNGDAVVLDSPVDVPGLLAHLELPDTGVAVAVDGVVRPRSRWAEELPVYATIDVLTAVQGG